MQGLLGLAGSGAGVFYNNGFGSAGSIGSIFSIGILDTSQDELSGAGVGA